MTADEERLELLRKIANDQTEMGREIRELRESMIRFETHGYNERLNSQSSKVDGLSTRLVVLETQGKFYTAGIATFFSALTAIVVGWFKNGAPH